MSRPSGPALSLLIGIALGIATLAIGYGVSATLSRKVEGLVAECHELNKRPVPADAPPWAKDAMICDPQVLLAGADATRGKLVGVQPRIIDTQTAAHVWQQRTSIAGFLLFAILALPYCWHFLLKRIAELRQAIVGR